MIKHMLLLVIKQGDSRGWHTLRLMVKLKALLFYTQ